MDAEHLMKIVRNDPVMRAVTWGVFGRDELPEGDLARGAYVVNSHQAPGQHWFLLCVGDVNELYDSLGRSPKDYNLDLNCEYSTKRLQALHSNTCGLYVLYFLYWRSRGVDMKSLFTSLKHESEKIVLNHYSLLHSLLL